MPNAVFRLCMPCCFIVAWKWNSGPLHVQCELCQRLKWSQDFASVIMAFIFWEVIREVLQHIPVFVVVWFCLLYCTFDKVIFCCWSFMAFFFFRLAMKFVFEFYSNTCSISLLIEGEEKCIFLEYALSAILLIFWFLWHYTDMKEFSF